MRRCVTYWYLWFKVKYLGGLAGIGRYLQSKNYVHMHYITYVGRYKVCIMTLNKTPQKNLQQS